MKRTTIACAAIVSLAALNDLRVSLRPGLAPVDTAALDAAKAALEAETRPGDQLVHSPLFSVAEAARLAPLKARPDRPAETLMRTRRVLLLDRSRQPMFMGRSESEVRSLGGGLRLRVFEPEAGSQNIVLYDLHDQLDERSMRVDRDGRSIPCDRARAEGGFACPGEADWVYAAAVVLRISGADTPCVWAHPTASGSLVLSIPPQPAPPPGRILELTHQGALTDDAAGTPGGAVVNTEIRQNGKRLVRMVVPNRIGWVEQKAVILPEALVEIEISTPKDGRRHYCVNARVAERSE